MMSEQEFETSSRTMGWQVREIRPESIPEPLVQPSWKGPSVLALNIILYPFFGRQLFAPKAAEPILDKSSGA